MESCGSKTSPAHPRHPPEEQQMPWEVGAGEESTLGQAGWAPGRSRAGLLS